METTTKSHMDFVAKMKAKMKVHLFGASSSPSYANYSLKQIATDYENEFGSEAAEFLRNDFYVDDGLRSTDSVEGANAC